MEVKETWGTKDSVIFDSIAMIASPPLSTEGNFTEMFCRRYSYNKLSKAFSNQNIIKWSKTRLCRVFALSSHSYHASQF